MTRDQTTDRPLLKPNHSFEEWWKNQLPPKSNEEWWKDYFNDPVVNSIVKYARYHSLYGWTARDAQVAELEAALGKAQEALEMSQYSSEYEDVREASEQSISLIQKALSRDSLKSEQNTYGE